LRQVRQAGPALVKHGVQYGLGSQLDLLATIADIANAKLPTDRDFDGQSLRATLASGAPSPRDTVPYYRNGAIYAMRVGPIKADFVTEGSYGAGEPRTEHEPPLYFDLSQDPSESTPFTGISPVMRDKVQAARLWQQRFATPAPSELTKGVPPAPTR
jgi:hypothetical protein